MSASSPRLSSSAEESPASGSSTWGAISGSGGGGAGGGVAGTTGAGGAGGGAGGGGVRPAPRQTEAHHEERGDDRAADGQGGLSHASTSSWMNGGEPRAGIS